MLDLSGINLNERHKELNKHVHEAFDKNENFEALQHLEEKSDVDRIFKIKLAILYKNVDYIVETLKCGDPLYISKALKCTALYDTKDIINPDYLHLNIFPFMSTKMKKKMLSVVATHIHDQKRVDSFYEYCINNKLNHIALKFLINASQSIKEDFLERNIDIDDSIDFEYFFGESHDLIEKYINKKKSINGYFENDLFRFCYLYSKSNEKYLDILESCGDQNNRNQKRFGQRISKDIMINHKARVLNRLPLYLRKLNKKIITKHSTSEDAKKYAVALLPITVGEFWFQNFYASYDYVLNILPRTEIFSFLKQIFESKYPNEMFEMNFMFYRVNYHELLTVDERHNWALKHIKEKKEYFGPMRDYFWYKFVKFDVALPEIKRYIYVNTSPDVRSELIGVLIEAASSQSDIEKLLVYYYERHVNESKDRKEAFIDKVIEYHNVLEFEERCWSPFNKILHSMDIFAKYNFQEDHYSILAVLYHILHFNDISELLKPFCILNRWSHSLKKYFNKLNSDQKEVVYKFLMAFFVNEITILIKQDKPEDVKKKLIENTWSALTLMDVYKKPKEECPEIVMSSIKLHQSEFQSHHWFHFIKLSEGDLLRLLKKDKMLIEQDFSETIYVHYKVPTLLKKIKVYFSNDTAKTMISYLENKLLELSTKGTTYYQVNPVIYNLFQLTNNEFKIEFMKKYTPTSPKIMHDKIDPSVLTIQEAICRLAHYSRPPVPLTNMLEYIKGDYVHFCLPMFNAYLVNLPMPLSLKFIEAILDAPVSIQKHGLRLAFECYNADNLKALVVNIWHKTTNISLRAIIYKALMNKISKEKEHEQTVLYETLKNFTSELGVSDDEEIYDLIVSSTLPYKYFGDFMKVAWAAVDAQPCDSALFTGRREKLIRHLTSHIDLMEREFCELNIIEEHLKVMFIEKHIINHDDTYSHSRLYREKWMFIAKYITHFKTEEDLENSLKLLNKIMKSCLEMWNEVHDVKYVVRDFLIDFLHNVKDTPDYLREGEQKPYIIPVYECVVDFLEEFLPIHFATIWEFKLAILFRKSAGVGEYNPEKDRITYDHLICENVAKDIGKGIVELVQQRFYPSLSEEISIIILHNLWAVINWTNLKDDRNRIVIALSDSLCEYTHHEVLVLALRLLPLDPPDEFKNEFYDVIEKITKFDNDELKALMYRKYITCDYKNRLGSIM